MELDKHVKIANAEKRTEFLEKLAKEANGGDISLKFSALKIAKKSGDDKENYSKETSTEDKSKSSLEKEQLSSSFVVVPLLDSETVLEGVERLTNVTKLPPAFCKLNEYERLSDSNLIRPFFDLVSDKSRFPEPVFPARIKKARVLTTEGSVKKAIELVIESDTFSYQPGDSIAIYPQNEKSIVSQILKRLNLDGSMQFRLVPVEATDSTDNLPMHIPNNCSYAEALTYFLDIAGIVKKALFRVLAEYASSERDKNLLMFLCSKQGTFCNLVYIHIFIKIF